MPGRKHDFDLVRKIALSLPDVQESTAYGSPALKVRGKLLACIPTHRSAEPESLVVCTGFEVRTDLLAAHPDIYYLPPHYQNHPLVLVRLSRIRTQALRDLLHLAWRFLAAKKTARNQPKPLHPAQPYQEAGPGSRSHRQDPRRPRPPRPLL